MQIKIALGSGDIGISLSLSSIFPQFLALSLSEAATYLVSRDESSPREERGRERGNSWRGHKRTSILQRERETLRRKREEGRGKRGGFFFAGDVTLSAEMCVCE